MGYGGSRPEAARRLGRSGDDGVDGVIDQDALGLDQIYVQAKRYKEGSSVGPGDIRDFFGSLDLKKATKGLFVAASSFTASARQTAAQLGRRIVLIDGEELARLMIRYSVGCRTRQTVELKQLDDDFFDGIE
jgi:restriction system protein